MKHKSYVLGSTVAVLSLAVGVYMAVYAPQTGGSNPLSPLVALLSSFFISVVAMLVADRFALQNELHNHLQKTHHDIVQLMHQRSPLRRFMNADEAIRHAVATLPDAIESWNTRLSPATVQIGSEASSAFRDSLMTAIEKGLRHHDIVCPAHLDYMAVVKDASNRKSTKGAYVGDLLDVAHPSINFLVLRFETGALTTYFGWPVSHESRGEMPVFMTTDERLGGFFIEYFNIMSRWSQKQ